MKGRSGPMVTMFPWRGAGALAVATVGVIRQRLVFTSLEKAAGYLGFQNVLSPGTGREDKHRL
jgi:hypothetical protein